MASCDDTVVQATARSAVADAGLELTDVSIGRGHDGPVVTVIIDHIDGVDADAASTVSRDIARRLDARDDEVFGGSSYTLEVTTPGVDRSLTEAGQFQRSVGRLVELTTVDNVGQRCRIARADASGLVVLTGKDGTIARTIPWREVDHAVVQVEFRRPPRRVIAVLEQWRESRAVPVDGSDVTRGRR